MLNDVFVCLDCESTGLDPKQDRLIEVAVTRFTFSEILGQFESLVNPECDIPKESQEIHKITKEMLQGKPSAKEVLPEVFKLTKDCILVGHGIPFDIALLAAEAKRNQVPTNIESLRFIDTLRLARHYGESPVNSLEQLRKHFNVPAEGAHRAMNDVVVNIEVFKHLAKPYSNAGQIFKLLEKPVRLRTMPLGKHKGRKFDEIPIEYLLWASRKDFDQDLLFSIRSEINNRKKGGGFEQSSNPFASL